MWKWLTHAPMAALTSSVLKRYQSRAEQSQSSVGLTSRTFDGNSTEREREEYKTQWTILIPGKHGNVIGAAFVRQIEKLHVIVGANSLNTGLQSKVLFC